MRPGSRVLVLGAAGGVGVFAVQLAHHLGAHVVGVCRPEFADQVRAFGANETVPPGDGVLKLRQTFDVILDTPPVFTFRQCEPLLKDGGTYIHTLPSRDAEGFELAKSTSKNAGYLMALFVKDDALIQVAKLIEAGSLKPSVDKVFPLAEVAAAHERFSTRGKLGRVVIDTSGA